MRFSLLFFFFLSSPLFSANDLAYEAYQKGERAKSMEERELFFNQALSFYLDLEETAAGSSLFYNIGNCYFQLKDYPLAILYYKKALKDYPRHAKAKEHLALSLDKLGLQAEKKSFLEDLLPFHYKYSIHERVEFCIYLFALFFVLASLYLYFRKTLLIQFSYFFGALASLFLLSISLSYCFAPLELILLKPAILRRDAGAHYSGVVEEPFLAGSTLRVLEQPTSSPSWLKVESEQGVQGFIALRDIRFIEES